MTKKITLFISFSSFIIFSLFAQYTELGGFAGTAYYIGDLAPSGYVKEFKPAYGLLFKYNFNPRFTYRGALTFGEVMAKDGLSNNLYQKQRNLSFNSKITELTNIIEFSFLPYLPGHKTNYYSSYVFVGFSFFRMDPSAKIGNTSYNLQLMGTEGQGLTTHPTQNKYSLVQIAFPIGIGFKTSLSKNINIAFEYGLRNTLTDYLDDVSQTYIDREDLISEKGQNAAKLGSKTTTNLDGKQRGNPSVNDWFVFSGMTLTFVIRKDKNLCEPAYPFIKWLIR